MVFPNRRKRRLWTDYTTLLIGTAVCLVYTGTSLSPMELQDLIVARGVWGLIQAQISQIDFDYSSYADSRLGEYQAWRREMDGSRAKAGDEMPLRERRWAQEA